MSKEQALKLLEELTAALKLSRKEHELVLMALKVLANETESLKEK